MSLPIVDYLFHKICKQAERETNRNKNKNTMTISPKLLYCEINL